MNPYDLPGVVGGMAGTWLFLAGFLVSLGAALRLVSVLRVPGKGRVARGLVAAGAVVALAGAALFYGAQATRHARAFDEAASWIAVASGVLGALAGLRVGRRGRRDPATDGRGSTPPSSAPPGPPPAP